MRHGRARQWGGAAEDGTEGLELLGVQGSASADKIHCVCSSKACEQGGAQLLHRCHVVRCELADGLQVALALARVLRKRYRDWTAGLLPRWQWSWGGVRLGACAAATTTC